MDIVRFSSLWYFYNLQQFAAALETESLFSLAFVSPEIYDKFFNWTWLGESDFKEEGWGKIVSVLRRGDRQEGNYASATATQQARPRAVVVEGTLRYQLSSWMMCDICTRKSKGHHSHVLMHFFTMTVCTISYYSIVWPHVFCIQS